MPDVLSVDTHDVIKPLEKFSDNIRIKVTGAASRAASKIVKKEMVSLARRRSGALRESIASRTKVDKAGGRAFSVIGSFKDVVDPNYFRARDKKISQKYKARFFEVGTKYIKADKFITKSLENTRARVEKEYDSRVEKQLKQL